MKRAPTKFESLFENIFFPTTNKIPLFDLEIEGEAVFVFDVNVRSRLKLQIIMIT